MKAGSFFHILWIIMLLFGSVFTVRRSHAVEITFAHGIDDWQAYTNDDNRLNGWEVRSGALFQNKYNDDFALGGERFLIREGLLHLGDMPGDFVEIGSDFMFLDFKGETEVKAGLRLFVNPSEPEAYGYIDANLIRDTEGRREGFQVSCGDWKSPFLELQLKSYHWYRCRLRVENSGANRLVLAAKVWLQSEDEPGEWGFKNILSGPVKRNRKALALYTSASHGYEVNPRIAVSGLLVSSVTPVSMIDILPPDPEGVVFSFMEEDLEFVFRHFKSGDGSGEHIYRDILRRIDLIEEDYPEYPELDVLKAAQMRSYGVLGQFDEFEELADKLEHSGLAKPFLIKERAGTEKHRIREYHAISMAMKNRNFIKAIDLIDTFILDYPEDPRKPELMRTLCHALFSVQKMKKRYWDVSNQFIEEEIVPDQVDEILYNQSLMHLREGAPERGREKATAILERYPTSDYFPLAMMARGESYLSRGELEILKTEMDVILNHYGINSYVGATLVYYYGVGLARKGEYEEAVKYLNDAMKAEFWDKEEIQGKAYIPVFSAKWLMYTAMRKPDIVSTERVINAVREMPASEDRDRFLRQYDRDRSPLNSRVNSLADFVNP